MIEGRINSFQSLSAVDGPGIRSVLFMQGCNLRCEYCHNPETQNLTKGSIMSSDEIVAKVKNFKEYYGVDGGLTVSGGEPLLQMPFIIEVFKRLKEEGITTCIETAGQYSGTFEQSIENITQLLGVTDYVYCDVKFKDMEMYRQHTKGSLLKVLHFMNLCDRLNKKIVVRQVVVPNLNDTYIDMYSFSCLLKDYKCIDNVILLPYSNIGKSKYAELKRTYALEGTDSMSIEKVKRLQAIFDKDFK